MLFIKISDTMTYQTNKSFIFYWKLLTLQKCITSEYFESIYGFRISPKLKGSSICTISTHTQDLNPSDISRRIWTEYNAAVHHKKCSVHFIIIRFLKQLALFVLDFAHRSSSLAVLDQEKGQSAFFKDHTIKMFWVKANIIS
jgi:hypothetical protein